jgi:hypothetical protein
VESSTEFMHRLLGMDRTLISGSWFFLALDSLNAMAMLLGHVSRKLRLIPLWLIGIGFGLPVYQALALVPLELVSWKAHIVEIIVYVGTFGIFVYVLICGWLMRRGAAKLTSTRGDQWTKEIDYLYLSIAAVGILISVAKSNATYGKLSAPETLSALLLTTALALCLVNTRAEVKGWNKSDNVIDPQGDRFVRE